MFKKRILAVSLLIALIMSIHLNSNNHSS